MGELVGVAGEAGLLVAAGELVDEDAAGVLVVEDAAGWLAPPDSTTLSRQNEAKSRVLRLWKLTVSTAAKGRRSAGHWNWDSGME